MFEGFPFGAVIEGEFGSKGGFPFPGGFGGVPHPPTQVPPKGGGGDGDSTRYPPPHKFPRGRYPGPGGYAGRVDDDVEEV